MNETVLRVCTMTLQLPLSNACGYHVIAFCLSIINNMSHYDYISMLSDNLTLNDVLVTKWVELAVHLYYCASLIN